MTQPNQRPSIRFTRWQWAGIIALGLLVVAAFVTLIATLIITTRSTVRDAVNGPPPASFAYSAPTYRPSRSPVCPGQTFTYTVSFHVDDDTILHVYTTLGSANQGHPNWRASGPPQVFVQEKGYVITATLGYTVPLGLPPGGYRLRLGAENATRDSALTVVPFVIPSGCAP